MLTFLVLLYGASIDAPVVVAQEPPLKMPLLYLQDKQKKSVEFSQVACTLSQVDESMTLQIRFLNSTSNFDLSVRAFPNEGAKNNLDFVNNNSYMFAFVHPDIDTANGYELSSNISLIVEGEPFPKEPQEQVAFPIKGMLVINKSSALLYSGQKAKPPQITVLKQALPFSCQTQFETIRKAICM